MISATCDHCGTVAEFFPFLAGQRVKCKACQPGWVKLLPPDPSTRPSVPPPPPPRTVIPPPVAPPQTVPVPPPPVPRGRTVDPLVQDWKRKHDPVIDPDDPVQPDSPDGPTVAEAFENPRRAPAWLRGVGFPLLFLGLGSVVLYFFGRQFRLLAWLEPYQPFAGMIMAGLGAALLLVYLLKR